MTDGQRAGAGCEPSCLPRSRFKMGTIRHRLRQNPFVEGGDESSLLHSDTVELWGGWGDSK
eukprot:365452-Chlamydomonas_euryale.AAC.2